MKSIFVVDGVEVSLMILAESLRPYYTVYTASSASQLFTLLSQSIPDLIILDLFMPEIGGKEILYRLREGNKTKDIPVIIVTGEHNPDLETSCLEAGAVDFILKPFSTKVLLNRVKLHIRLEDIIKEKIEQLQQLQTSVVNIMAGMVEGRDKITGGHLDRTALYLKILANAIMDHSIYSKEMRKFDLDLITSSAKLHDVGKVVVPDAILNKPDKLTIAEFEIIKTHAAEGERIITQMANQAGNFEFLQYARLFAGFHHERWDGTGYPHGISGMDIPLLGRLMAVVDVYDALTTNRPYKCAFPPSKALDIIRAEAGTHFDAEIVKILLQEHEHFKLILKFSGDLTNPEIKI